MCQVIVLSNSTEQNHMAELEIAKKMAELEIDKEDVNERKKWRRNVMKRKSNPNRKRTINR